MPSCEEPAGLEKTITLANALCEQGIAIGFAEVRRLVHAEAITVNGVLAESWDMPVKQGDVIACGKHKVISIGPIRGEECE
jgi:ribosomal protein S4